jgi:UDP-2,3-diacylglucosamine hydrolase
MTAASGTAEDLPLAIICGAGSIPAAVAEAVVSRGRRVVLFALRGWAEGDRLAAFPHHWIAVGQFGRFCRLARAEGCRDLVLVGTLVRPALAEIRLDWATVMQMPKIIRAFRGGDDHLLGGIARVFEMAGFHVVGAHEVAPEITAPLGAMGRHLPSAEDEHDIARGFALLAALSPFDVGQAAVIAGSRVVAVEAAEGTDALLERVAAMRKSGRLRTGRRSGVLVKAPKRRQDRRFDLPSIGPQTIARAMLCGLAGIAVIAGATIAAEPQCMIEQADRAGLFVVGRPDPEALS